jgi:hypothetical protein
MACSGGLGGGRSDKVGDWYNDGEQDEGVRAASLWTEGRAHLLPAALVESVRPIKHKSIKDTHGSEHMNRSDIEIQFE